MFNLISSGTIVNDAPQYNGAKILLIAATSKPIEAYNANTSLEPILE